MKVLNPNEETRQPAQQQVPAPEVSHSKPMDMAELRAQLEKESGPRFWRSFEELAGKPEFQQMVEREFPRYAPGEWDEGSSRRTFLQLGGASLALAGLAGCTRQPDERIIPYVSQPEDLIPGKPMYYASAYVRNGYAVGVLVESHMGRPTKLDGNPDLPNGGASDAQTQAEILRLYDPDRSQGIERLGRLQTWNAFTDELGAALQAQEALGGEGLRILAGASSSPTVAALYAKIRERFPQVTIHSYDPAAGDGAHDGAMAAFGEAVGVHYDFEQADVVLTLDADPLAEGPGALSAARGFASRRRARNESDGINRLYSIESSPTRTGSLADHRIALRTSEIGRVAAAIAGKLGIGSGAALDGDLEASVDAIVADLQGHTGRSIVVAGEHASADLHALAHGINAALGNVGTTVSYSDPILNEPSSNAASLSDLVDAMNGGSVDVLLMLGVNPVYTAPSSLGFAAALDNVTLRVHLGTHKDETVPHCQWHVGETHFLESWTDGRTADGTLALGQPLIEPLYGGKSAIQVLSVVAGEEGSDYDLVKNTWQAAQEGDAEAAWRRAVHDGFVADSASAAREVTLAADAVASAAQALGSSAQAAETLDASVRPDPSVGDGSYANSGWLQELPKPFTLLTWDNAALLSPRTAARLAIKTEDVIRIRAGEGAVEIPALVQPGHADDAVTVHLGYGRTAAGRVGNDIGVDVSALRDPASPWSATVQIEQTGRRYRLATTQTHHDIEEQIDQAKRRGLVRTASFDYFQDHPDFAHHVVHEPDPKYQMFPDWEYKGYSWGMAIDLSTCMGCSACVIACQAENNIPVVGKKQVLNGREMHWLRIDRYYEGDIDAPKIHHQPIACMHCDRAPCEIVCPVAATVHGDEGLNEMAYNRCIGTRYCSNNCPYKVRRFNFLRYNDYSTPVLKLQRNPDVSIRMRGVMEKCTYCVQRINAARTQAKLEDRKIGDGDVRTACQDACPTGAIAFGDLNDPESEVNRWKSQSHNYGLLPELATAPRSTYLAKINNPNPVLGGDDHSEDGESHGGDDAAPA